MKFFKEVLALILISLTLVLLSGAEGCAKTETRTSNVGLNMAFVEGAPPVNIVVNKEFPIYVDVQNMGGSYINKGRAKFYMSGIGKNLKNVKTSLVNDVTFEKEALFPERIVFAEKAKFDFPLQNIFVQTLVLTSCYDYGGIAQATVCITSANESKICDLKTAKIISNTAGPVKIGSITETLAGDKLQIYFDIVNLGTGQPFQADTECDKLEANEFSESQKQGKVNIEIQTNEAILCKLQSETAPFGQISGLKGVAPIGKVMCEKKLTTEDYQSPLTISLRYKYRDSISQNINVIPA